MGGFTRGFESIFILHVHHAMHGFSEYGSIQGIELEYAQAGTFSAIHTSESDCSSRAWVKTLAHNALVNLLVVYLRSCGMQHVRSEIKYWDPCRVGEKEKQDSWNEAIHRRQDIAAAHVSFVPFSIEAGGVWGPAAKAFFEEAAFYNHYNERDIDRYHWNTAKFKTLWRTKFAVLMARERERIGSDAALGDMPKRLQAHSYDEMNEGPAR